MTDIRAIPTSYLGIDFHSRLEARWALFLEIRGHGWKYEPRGYGQAPDFETDGITIEAKGRMPNRQYIDFLRSIKTNFIAIGGFFEYQAPKLIRITPRGIRGDDFFRVFPHRILFNRACEYRFDLE